MIDVQHFVHISIISFAFSRSPVRRCKALVKTTLNGSWKIYEIYTPHLGIKRVLQNRNDERIHFSGKWEAQTYQTWIPDQPVYDMSIETAGTTRWAMHDNFWDIARWVNNKTECWREARKHFFSKKLNSIVLTLLFLTCLTPLMVTKFHSDSLSHAWHQLIRK